MTVWIQALLWLTGVIGSTVAIAHGWQGLARWWWPDRGIDQLIAANRAATSSRRRWEMSDQDKLDKWGAQTADAILEAQERSRQAARLARRLEERRRDGNVREFRRSG